MTTLLFSHQSEIEMCFREGRGLTYDGGESFAGLLQVSIPHRFSCLAESIIDIRVSLRPNPNCHAPEHAQDKKRH